MNEGVLSGYLTVKQTAKQLNICTRTLVRWDSLRIGPPVTMVGRRKYYRITSVQDWLIQNELKTSVTRRKSISV